MSARPSLVVIGCGPRGTGVIERIAANAGELYGDTPLDLHVVDPHPPGGGRIWRPDQSPLLWMNSMAEDVTMFTDETVELAGPVVAGPALDAWADDVRAGRVTPDADPAVLAEIHGLTGSDFPTRRLQSAYLRWTYERARAALPPGVTVHEHRTTALAVTGPRGGPQRVRLQGRPVPLLADLVVLTVGHLDAEEEPEQAGLGDFARRHGLVHLPPDFTADSDLGALRPGEPVIVRGFGLAFVDLMVLLTEGRGGRHEDGVYLPSGREPVLYVGSRRGVPYHAKIGYAWTGERPPLPRHLGPDWTEAALRSAGPLDFRRDVWPAVVKELGHAHYHRLFTAHPERTALAHEVFADKYAAADPGSPELAALVAEAVPDPADRLDLDALDRPLDGVRHPSPDALQEALRAYITDDLARRHDPGHSEDLAVFLGLLSAYAQLVRLGDIGGWWHGFFSYLASGPPGPRLHQLLALSRAGVVRFLGADLMVEADEERGLFRARSATVPGAVTEARALVEARLPDPSLRHTASPLLRALRDEGAAVTGS
ncbi:FAD/NAD(P)-binding protein, partial [Streptomyces sp. SID10692]|uniref:FAD/NAD(P)-binding protein n=1 Tax=Streptomyces sp. SID10692 TaxID=2706026 RepID=UPI0013DA1080|nr:FAD/NAD(P)-binding protein [Streptomyces sp. SID10692]